MTEPLTSRENARFVGRRAVSAGLMAMTTMTWCLLGGAGLASAAAAAGQSRVPADSPWLPWLGCWQLVEETGALKSQAGATGPFEDPVVVCLRATRTSGAESGVEVSTMAGGEPVLVDTLWADGAEHPVEEAACTGWRRNIWSGDGARLFTRAELACPDENVENDRRVSGVGLMTSSTTWLDIQLVDSGARGEVTVRRYRRASESTTVDAGATPLPADILDRARNAARLGSTSALSVEDVIEASAEIEPAVVEAMLVETRASFALNGRALIQLVDGGVPDDVVDLMVALSFPDEFIVDRPAARAAASFGGGGFGFADQFGPYGYDTWYPYYASPFGYYYGWSPYNSLYFLGPAASYVIVPDGLDGLNGRSRGRAYQGRGFSQIGVREPTTDRRAQPRNPGGSITSSQGASRSGGGSSGSRGGSSGGGRATPGGYTRGGSTGRTATPRDR
ncbi:MAG TPA: hypothetical protein QF572_21985 [Vicinamibacterales bacterium]|jgi:hypothetical protein|nr:hypothetical protein [Vicinamibacterales bacterium]